MVLNEYSSWVKSNLFDRFWPVAEVGRDVTAVTSNVWSWRMRSVGRASGEGFSE